MCESCLFLNVSDFKTAIHFAKQYVLLRIRNLVQLRLCGKLDEFLEAKSAPKISYQEMLDKLVRMGKLVEDYEIMVISEEQFLKEIEETSLQHVLFGLEQHFPESVKSALEEQIQRRRSEPSTNYEKLCHALYCMDCYQ